MPHKQKTFVLDSWAILAYLEDEPAGQKVGDIIADAHENGDLLLMTAVNAGEVWHIIAREAMETDADRSLNELREIGIEIIDVDWKLTHGAAGFKAQYRMSFADCFAVALAKDRKATLVTGDPELRQLGGLLQMQFLA